MEQPNYIEPIVIPQAYLDDLLSKVELVDLIKGYVPDLKRTGSNYSGCCPFHTEETASFTVSPQKEFYHCFGCGAHGNAISFLMEFNTCNFVAAVTTLSSSVGMEMPKKEQAGKTDEEKETAMKFMRTCGTMKTAQEIFTVELEKHAAAREYLDKRGLTQETIELFGIGYAPDAWDTISKNKSISRDGAEWGGLTTNKPGSAHKYDRFRDRIVFPIYGAKDFIIGFGGRAISNQDPKYLNSPEGEFFKKGENLYGLRQAQRSNKTANRVFVVEGYMDTVMLAQHGVPNTVASMGTAVTETQIKKLMRSSAQITFCMDGDKPGRAAGQKIAEALLPHMNDLQKLDLMFLPNEMDPDEFVRENGLDAFLAEAEKSRSVIDFLVDGLKEREDTSKSDGMARYLTCINEWAELVPYPPLKLALKKRAADMANISLDALLGMTAAPDQPQIAAPPPQAWQQAPQNSLSISVAARMLGIAAVREPALTAQMEDIGFLEPFLTLQDREMLFPLLVYIKTNPAATKEAIAASLAYNPHIVVIQELILAAQLLGERYDARAEAKSVMDGFRRMERVWQIIGAQEPKK